MKLTLGESWQGCITQWDAMIAKIKAGDTRTVGMLKEEWCEQNGYEEGELMANCFFCEYDDQRNKDCSSCPVRLIDPLFNCCNDPYHYRHHPLTFHAKIHELYKKYQESKDE